MNPSCNHKEAQEDPLWCPPIQIHIVLSSLSPQGNSAQFQLAEKTARKHKNITEQPEKKSNHSYLTSTIISYWIIIQQMGELGYSSKAAERKTRQGSFSNPRLSDSPVPSNLNILKLDFNVI